MQPDFLGATTALLRGSQGEQQTAREGAHLVRAAVESGESHSHVTCAGSLPHGAGNNPSFKPDPWILALSQGLGLRRLYLEAGSELTHHPAMQRGGIHPLPDC